MGQEKMFNTNRNIKANKILLITEEGNNIISLNDALYRARNMGMDLVEVGTKDNMPVCKIIDYGKWKYEQEKKKKKSVQPKQLQKEIKFRPNTSVNDLKYRACRLDEFLKDGHKVKVVVMFKGREQEHMFETGKNILEKFLQMISVKYNVLNNVAVEGGAISLILAAG